MSEEVSALKQRLLDQDLAQDLESSERDKLIQKLEDLENLESEMIKKDEFESLTDKVNHFVQSLLKVIALPAEVERLKMKIDELASNDDIMAKLNITEKVLSRNWPQQQSKENKDFCQNALVCCHFWPLLRMAL